MPTDRTAPNGLNTYSLHAYEESSAALLDRLRDERRSYPGFALDQAKPQRLDPETAARRYLTEALDSPSVPSLTALEAGGASSGFKTISTETVRLTGTKTVKFRQTLHEIPVYGSLVTVELDDDNTLVGIDSALGRPDGVDPVADVSPAQALTAAQHAPDGYTPTVAGVVPRLHYYFDRVDSRWRLVYILEDVPVRRSRPSPSSDRDAGAESFEPPRFVDYVVDAHDGEVVAVLPRTPSVITEGNLLVPAADDRPCDEHEQEGEQTALDAFGVLRTFVATSENGHLVLRDPDHNVETYDFGFADPVVQAHELPGALIGNPPTWTPAAVSSHANAVAVSQFLRTVLLRNNIDDRGGALISTVNCVVTDASPGHNEWRNAFWNSRQMVYGQVRHGNELLSLAANIDVVAHEIFHGVTEHTSRLEYAFQPGALNESYSDIFGTIIANAGVEDPRTWDWLLGERLLPGDRPFRDLSDPARFGQPAHMDDFQVLPDTQEGDWGGVHINSGIHNLAAFNLLTATHDDGTLIMPPSEVAGAFYLALTQRLSRTSQFSDSRRAVVASARTLLRRQAAVDQDRKVQAIEDAFDAVGISS